MEVVKVFNLVETFGTKSRLWLCLRPALKNFKRDCIPKDDKRQRPHLMSSDDVECARSLLNFLTKEEISLFIPYLQQIGTCKEEEVTWETGGLQCAIDATKKLLTLLESVSIGTKTWERRIKYKKEKKDNNNAKIGALFSL